VTKRFAIAALAVLMLGFALPACGGDDEPEEDTAESSLPSDCEEVSAPEPREVSLDPPPSKPSGQDLVAVVDTSCGTFEIALDTKLSPKTTASFEYLAENGVYDDTLFHRIIPGFVIQAGDPSNTGSGPDPGYTIDEPPPTDFAYTQGVVAMAKTEVEPPGRSGSQFFVVLPPQADVQPVFAVLGEVTEGFDVVETIAELGSPDGSGSPLEPVVIDSVTIEAG
jgi:peptidyl-prolyl cis-trans isomerase B (cyclophilin B)